MILGDPTLAGDFLYQQKLTALSQRYSIRTEVITFEFESKATNQYFFTKVINPGEVPIDLDEQGELRWQPYWAEDWESSRALCRLLLERDIAGLSILDLGCGLGLTGAVAASQGARVTLADNAQPALDFSEINCWIWSDFCDFRIVDWQRNYQDLGPFDLIVGAEIIYDSDDWNDLEKFWRTHLAPKGAVWLCDPFRRTGKEFRDWIQNKRWTSLFTDMDMPEFEKPTNVIELTLDNS